MATAIEMYTELYPDARTELAFLQAILTFQASRAAQLEPGPILALEVAQTRWQEGRPLLDAAALAAPRRYMQESLAALRPVLSARPAAQAILDRLLVSGLVEPAADEALLFDLNRGGRDRIEHLAAAISVDAGVLAAVTHIALASLYQQRAAPYQGWLDAANWQRGECPLCGVEPSMARLGREDGRRVLVCSRCRSEWTFARLCCPFCATDQRPQLRHFTVDADPAHRVECCAQCRRYLKTIDERRIDYQPFIPAEEIVTADLDNLARAHGYQS
jgi:FdhE protein